MEEEKETFEEWLFKWRKERYRKQPKNHDDWQIMLAFSNRLMEYLKKRRQAIRLAKM